MSSSLSVSSPDVYIPLLYKVSGDMLSPSSPVLSSDVGMLMISSLLVSFVDLWRFWLSGEPDVDAPFLFSSSLGSTCYGSTFCILTVLCPIWSLYVAELGLFKSCVVVLIREEPMFVLGPLPRDLGSLSLFV